MSEFLRHEPCPICGSKDNLGIYTDHEICFGCGYIKHYSNNYNSRLLSRKNNNNNGNSIALPSDFVRNIPDKGLAWLNQYDLTWQEISQHHMGWSEAGVTLGERHMAPLLVFPIYDMYGNLLMWQGRYMGDNVKSGFKYYTKGAKDVLHLLGKGDKLIVVEDLISAIKLSRVARAIPLWGSSISLDFLMRLHTITDNFTIWLDSDKAQYAHKIAQKAQQWFKRVDVIHSELDPKCYTTSDIEGYLI